MKRFEPNLLLALSTALAFALLLLTTAVFGAAEAVVRNVLLALACVAGFVLLNPLLQRAMKIVAGPPMIHAGAPGTAVWAALFPLMVIIAAAVPMVWPGHDYGLLIIIAAVWLAVTVESALKAAKAGPAR